MLVSYVYSILHENLTMIADEGRRPFGAISARGIKGARITPSTQQRLHGVGPLRRVWRSTHECLSSVDWTAYPYYAHCKKQAVVYPFACVLCPACLIPCDSHDPVLPLLFALARSPHHVDKERRPAALLPALGGQ